LNLTSRTELFVNLKRVWVWAKKLVRNEFEPSFELHQFLTSRVNSSWCEFESTRLISSPSDNFPTHLVICPTDCLKYSGFYSIVLWFLPLFRILWFAYCSIAFWSHFKTIIVCKIWLCMYIWKCGPIIYCNGVHMSVCIWFDSKWCPVHLEKLVCVCLCLAD
jgi:hypothetical protein